MHQLKPIPGLDPAAAEKLAKALQARLDNIVTALNQGNGRLDLYLQCLQIVNAFESETQK